MTPGTLPAALSWNIETKTVFTGSASKTGDQIELKLANRKDSSETFNTICKPVRTKVAPATAVRVRDPKFKGECGNAGVWSPAKLVPIDALSCTIHGDPELFAVVPGIERLGVSADCYMQGEGLRLIPKDGSLAPAVRPSKK